MLLQRWRLRRQLRRALRPQAAPEPVVVATCFDEVSARLIAGRLTDAGIQPFVLDQTISAATGYPIVGRVEVLVHAEDEAAARALLDEQPN